MIARLTAAVAVLALALTGCASDSESPAAEPSASKSSAPQNPPPSNVPAYAQNGGRPGAEQFVGYWVNTLNRATENGEIEQLAALSAPTCRMCASYAMGIDEIYDAGGHVKSDGWDVREIVHEGGGSDARRVLVITVQQAPQKVWRSEDAKPEEFTGGERMYRMVLSRNGSTWIVDDLAPRSSQAPTVPLRAPVDTKYPECCFSAVEETFWVLPIPKAGWHPFPQGTRAAFSTDAPTGVARTRLAE